MLKHLGDNLQNAVNQEALDRKGLKYVCRRTLEALNGLHRRGYVHTGMVVVQVRLVHSSSALGD